jgi:hypothetical protein
MAELLKRRYDLMVLKTELGHWSGTRGSASDEARFTLQYKSGGALQDGPAWTFPIGEIAPGERLTSRTAIGRGPEFRLPLEMLDVLKDWFHFEVEGEKPLWIHLVKPYGILRFVPWERVLSEAVRAPILMLPDFIFPPPREEVSRLDVAICGSAPLGYEVASVRNEIFRMVDRIRFVAGRKVNLHVFTDPDIAGNLSQTWEESGLLGENLRIYANETAKAFVGEAAASPISDRSDCLRSPWLLWMREALASHCVDVVHFVCHGYLNREKGSLLFSQSPLERTDRFLAGPVGTTELVAFLTQVGAWSSVFTNLPDNHSEPGLRALADDIAQTRPGPMMMYSAQLDPDGKALESAYPFLYSFQRNEAPASPSLFIYCQPYLTFPHMADNAVDAGTAVVKTAVKPAPLLTRMSESIKPTVARKIHDMLELFGMQGVLSTTTGDTVALPVPGGTEGAPPASALQSISIQKAVSENVLRNDLQKLAVASAAADSPLDSAAGKDSLQSTLVASTERFVEQLQLRYQQLARDEVLESGARGKEMRIVFDTMQKLRQAVADQNVRKNAGSGGA